MKESDFIEFTYLGIPYRIPPDVDGKPTIRRARHPKVIGFG